MKDTLLKRIVMNDLKNSVLTRLTTKLTFIIVGCILIVGCTCMPYVKPKFTTDPTKAVIFSEKDNLGIEKIDTGIICRY